MEIQWPLVFFTLLACLGAGTFAFVGASEWWGKAERARMPAAVTAVVALAAGGVASVLHLGHPERIFNALGHFGSGIFFEMLFVGLTGLAALAYVVAIRSKATAGTRKLIATIGMIFAIATAIAMGASYVLSSRPAWNTLLLPLLYLASAAVLGSFVFAFWVAVTKEGERHAPVLERAMLVSLAVQAVLLFAYLMYLAAAPHQNPNRSVSRLLSGDLALIFWIGLVLVGLVAPLYLAWRALQAKAKGLSPLAVAIVGLACVLIGGIVFRATMYLMGTSIAQFF